MLTASTISFLWSFEPGRNGLLEDGDVALEASTVGALMCLRACQHRPSQIFESAQENSRTMARTPGGHYFNG